MRHALTKGFDRRRLRWLLLALFAALALPTALVVWQAWSQLKWEAFHQYRGSAEELTERIDAQLAALIAGAERRSFEEFSFLLAPGSAASNVVQRSPLSNYPVPTDLPGLVGYFQVDGQGRFSTPLLPASESEATELGIAPLEYAGRRALAEDIRSVLAENELVPSRQFVGEVRRLEEERAERPAAPAETPALSVQAEYSQQAFDELGARKRAATAEAKEGSGRSATAERVANAIGKVSDIPLDASLQSKIEVAERDSAEALDDGADNAARQVLYNALPASAAPANAPLHTFASEVDRYESSILDSGHLVLYRNVWRAGERYVQGLLIDGQRFIADAIGAGFTSASLAERSRLIVAYDDDVIASFSKRAGSGYSSDATDLGGDLLYRSRLSAPLDSLELIYSVQALPPGPGAKVLAWLSLLLVLVFLGGFAVLYRLGAGQIRLARQQQDFVSAVSHELKTPLTSIRMYGEMLQQGWADESKRQTYYAYIHDEAERLSRLIANVLQLASITRNEPKLNMKPVSVRELLDNVESRIASQVERAGFTLQLQRTKDADAAVIHVDQDCFLQVIINLVDNAIKFSKNADEKVVEIDCRLRGGTQVRFAVRDFGPGVPRDQRQKIFELFYRSESELTRETVGTGIGLAIVHQLTLAMHGSVDLVNAEPGAEFRLLFPVMSA